MHTKINYLIGTELRLSPGCLISKAGKIFMVEDAVIVRWNEIIRGLYDGEREELTKKKII